MTKNLDEFALGQIINLIIQNKSVHPLSSIFFSCGESYDPGLPPNENLALILRGYYENQDKFVDFMSILIGNYYISGNQLERIDANLRKIGYKIERGLVVKILIEDDFYEFIEQCLLNPKIFKAEEGAYDGALITLTENLMEKNEDFILVDFGCGDGRLVYALNNMPDRVLKHLTYIGVDKEESIIKKTEDTIKNIDFNKKIKNYHIFKIVDFFASKIYVDYIFMVNVLHEIPIYELPELLNYFEIHIKHTGKLLVHEMRELIEGEINFISWEHYDFERTFKNTSFDMSTRTYNSKSGAKLINVHLIKNRETVTDIEVIITNLKDMASNKILIIDKEIEELFQKGDITLHKRLAYLLILRHNIIKQKEKLIDR